MYLPYGLDCMGFLNWAFRNAGLPSDGHWYIGTNLAAATWADALQGVEVALYWDYPLNTRNPPHAPKRTTPAPLKGGTGVE